MVNDNILKTQLLEKKKEFQAATNSLLFCHHLTTYLRQTGKLKDETSVPTSSVFRERGCQPGLCCRSLGSCVPAAFAKTSAGKTAAEPRATTVCQGTNIPALAVPASYRTPPSCFHFSHSRVIAGIARGAGLWSPINIFTAHVGEDRSLLPVPAFLRLPQKSICLQEETTGFFPEALGGEKVSHCQAAPALSPKGARSPLEHHRTRGWANSIASTIVYADTLKKTTNTNPRFNLKLVFVQDGFLG